MIPDKKPHTLFLAAPGSNMGADAKWKKPEDVRRFFEKVARLLGEHLGREVTLQVEKERRQSGAIHTTMFKAIYESDIFIGTSPVPILMSASRWGFAWRYAAVLPCCSIRTRR